MGNTSGYLFFVLDTIQSVFNTDKNMDGRVPIAPRLSANARAQPSPQRTNASEPKPSPSVKSSPRIQPAHNPLATDSPTRVSKPQSPSKNIVPAAHSAPAAHSVPAINKSSVLMSSKYTDDEISTLLADGYIKIPRELWDYLPIASHIRFFKVDDGNPKNTRFRPGGYLKNHLVSNDNRKLFLIENREGGNTRDTGYISFPMAHKDIAEVWKRYPKDAFIEIHLIYMSLAQKKKQIEDLESRLQLLESQRQ